MNITECTKAVDEWIKEHGGFVIWMTHEYGATYWRSRRGWLVYCSQYGGTKWKNQIKLKESRRRTADVVFVVLCLATKQE